MSPRATTWVERQKKSSKKPERARQKPPEPTFEELVQSATLDIHSSLLQGGGNEMKSTVWKWLSAAIDWSRRKKK